MYSCLFTPYEFLHLLRCFNPLRSRLLAPNRTTACSQPRFETFLPEGFNLFHTSLSPGPSLPIPIATIVSSGGPFFHDNIDPVDFFFPPGESFLLTSSAGTNASRPVPMTRSFLTHLLAKLEERYRFFRA